MVTSSRQLECWMRHHPRFRGVLSRDQVNRNLLEGCYIVNTDTLNLSGTHCICLDIFRDYVLYFDPFGWLPITSICRRISLPIFKNKESIQNFIFSTCGYHCVFFLYNRRFAINDFEAVKFVRGNASFTCE